MAHPFAKIFDRALRTSSPEENVVLEEAEKLKDKGYGAEEIHTVLSKMYKGLIDEEDREIVGEAVEEMGRYFDEE